MNRRAKGYAFQKLVASVLRFAFPEALSSGHERGVPDISGTPGFWIECRHRNAASIPGLLREAETRRASVECIPVAVTKTNRGDVLATVKLNDFVRLARALDEERRRGARSLEAMRRALEKARGGR